MRVSSDQLKRQAEHISSHGRKALGGLVSTKTPRLERVRGSSTLTAATRAGLETGDAGDALTVFAGRPKDPSPRQKLKTRQMLRESKSFCGETLGGRVIRATETRGTTYTEQLMQCGA